MSEIRTWKDVEQAAQLLRHAGLMVFVDTYDLRGVGEALAMGAGEEAAIILAAGELARALWDGESITAWRRMARRIEQMLRHALDLSD